MSNTKPIADLGKLNEMLEILGKDIQGFCSEASIFIGEVDGIVYQLKAMSIHEAEEYNDYDELESRPHKCVWGIPHDQ